MNKSIQYYAMIFSRWVPTDPSKAFVPFVLSIVRNEQISQTTNEEIIKLFIDRYGFSINLFLLTTMINKFVNQKICIRKNGFIHFNLSLVNQTDLIDDTLVLEFSNRTKELINAFIQFDSSNSLSEELAEKTLLSFVSIYDINAIKFGKFDDSDDDCMFSFTEFIRTLPPESRLMEILLNICEGVMIQSLLLKDNYESTRIFKDQKIILDTPILIKTLGYEGEFLYDEYSFLIEAWKKHGAKLYAFSHSINEVDSVLSTSAKWVNHANYDPALTSWTTMYFKSISKTQDEVLEEKAQFRHKLQELGINIISTSNPEISRYSESEIDVKNAILTEYGPNQSGTYKYGLEEWNNIDYDVRSICWTYQLRANNDLRELNQSKYIFVTTNNTIVRAIHQYHQKKYGDTISPIFSDSYIGMLVIANQPQEIQGYFKANIISFCHVAYRPGPQKRRKYIEKVKELEAKQIITREDVFLLEHSMFSQDPIPEILDEENYADVLGRIKAQLILDIKEQNKIRLEEEKKAYETKLTQINQEHNELSKKKDEDYIKRINILTKTNEQLQNKLDDDKKKQIDRAKTELANKKKWHYAIYYIVSTIFMSAILFVSISSIVFTNVPRWIQITVSAIFGIFVLFTSFDVLIPKMRYIIELISRRLKQKIAKKYGLEIEDF